MFCIFMMVIDFRDCGGGFDTYYYLLTPLGLQGVSEIQQLLAWTGKAAVGQRHAGH